MTELSAKTNRNENPNTFETQFQDVRNVEVCGGSTEYVDLRPERLENDTPVLVASGWSSGRESLHEVGRALFENGRRTLLINHARSGDEPPESLLEFYDDTLQRAEGIIRILDDAGIAESDVITHSEGFISTVAAALSRPDLFSAIAANAPAGMIGKDTFLQQFGRFTRHLSEVPFRDLPRNPRAVEGIMLGGIRYIAQNIPKAYREADAMANTPVDHLLNELRGKGIKIAILQMNKDRIFPSAKNSDWANIPKGQVPLPEHFSPKTVDRHVQLEGPFSNVDLYASYASKDAGHYELIVDPTRSIEANLEILNQLHGVRD